MNEKNFVYFFKSFNRCLKPSKKGAPPNSYKAMNIKKKKKKKGGPMFWLTYLSGGVIGNLAVVWRSRRQPERPAPVTTAIPSGINEVKDNWWEPVKDAVGSHVDYYSGRASDFLYKLVNDHNMFVGSSACVFALSGFDFFWTLEELIRKVKSIYSQQQNSGRDQISMLPTIAFACFWDVLSLYGDYQRLHPELWSMIQDISQSQSSGDVSPIVHVSGFATGVACYYIWKHTQSAQADLRNYVSSFFHSNFNRN
ncbi:hypothetical protein RFI_10135, partial [Reticulomyxa filosa]